MTLKQTIKAQESLVKYIEDGMQPMTSQQAYEACGILAGMRDRSDNDVVKTALHCLECTLYNVYIDRKPEP